MSSKSKNRYSNEVELAGGFATIYLALALIVAYVVFKVSFFTVLTFIKYYKVKWLWIALGGAVVASVTGVILFKVFAIGAFLLFIPIGIALLLITCLTVQLNCSESLLRENVNLLSDVLNTSWWSSDGAPKKGVEREPVAA